MGGFFGITSTNECLTDVFFGVDYHSHLGTRLAGMAAYDREKNLQRTIHSIDNTPFRSKFADIFREMKGSSAIGCISDTDPQPLLIRSKHGYYAICVTGVVNNAEALIENYLEMPGTHMNSMSGGKVNSTELVAALISQRDSLVEGIHFAHAQIDGTASILILRDDGSLIAARDRFGRLPVHIGKREDGYAVSLESFAYQKLGFEDVCELGPGEIVCLTPEGITPLAPPGKEKRICAFLWSYYGYPTASYEGISVEAMRYRNGQIMARHEAETLPDLHIDYVGGVPDSGTPHAIGYSNESFMPFARAFIKYTPTWNRSFMPPTQADRERIAKMKQIPVKDMIEGKNLLFVDDSIVRGTQLKETVEFLYENGAKAVHMRSACPPIMFGCKFLNFSRSTSDMDLIARRVIQELEGEEGMNHLEEYSDGRTERGKALRNTICQRFHFASLDFQTLEGVVEAIGLPREELCTYCWDGKE
ncbi:MAG: amidophosphoribosyltransferase [Lachnospiraceae bacterium]|nr:amidophosphoribosyltransferase [Lachnospiraceae bacterium]